MKKAIRFGLAFVLLLGGCFAAILSVTVLATRSADGAWAGRIADRYGLLSDNRSQSGWSVSTIRVTDGFTGSAGDYVMLDNVQLLYGRDLTLKEYVEAAKMNAAWQAVEGLTAGQQAALSNRYQVALLANWEEGKPLPPAAIPYGDVNGDKAIDAKDALLVLQQAVDKIDKFPVEQ